MYDLAKIVGRLITEGALDNQLYWLQCQIDARLVTKAFEPDPEKK